MKYAKYLTLLFFLIFIEESFAGESFSFNKSTAKMDSIHSGLSSLEWRKFKKFEEALLAAELSERESENELTVYARDSLKILKVKLMAIKVLEEKNLLNRDIAENPSYYTALMEEFKGSNIPSSEYLFLEEKLAYINQETLRQRLQWSTWSNIGLVIIVVLLAYITFRLGKGRKPILPQLSKQETLVRNLILQGKSNKEIAAELFISLSTVKSHITNIYSKLNVVNRQELLKKSPGTST
ncbi:response regulator transcription factor [Allomuricauda sp. F6463D]|uniref:response regulator transcription factor n=1 Tax=Allomuricauda sp. F6463D TaxID=2926409 RepID=UPI001FF63494|nr:helix-turn-helix transcriptional regulator [Muricauda sp. F6463D]MCK0161781.1 helix-turn-helix transcriptional regulator [Muricauda sp. F6463D]